MLDYRLYFLDRFGAIQAREEFTAADDNVATVVARVACAACADLCDGYELWQGSRLVVRTNDGATVVPTDHQVMAAQQVVIQIEESLQGSHWRIAQSAKLLEETARLKERLASR